jgi:hypothetical protein
MIASRRNNILGINIGLSRADSTLYVAAIGIRHGSNTASDRTRSLHPGYPSRASSTAWIEICDHAEILSRNAM